ncbi:MAG: Mfa1 fimbrilin C-terminal domain-containing protein, partial [Muribaculaceae bacterium]|nr:Mfa1 fimbrilin C-terminal domain-containing protein [Muribaculaceae bacterium]
MTVLNQPENFRPGRTLDDMGKIVLDSWDSGNSNGRFIMTTSSYFGDDNADIQNGGNRFFATRLNENNFYQQTPDQIPVEDADRVQIYVERLAVRVGVDMKGITNEKGSAQYTDPETGKSYDTYRIDASVAGDDNPSVGGTGAGAAATKLYVAVTGWDLNTTAKRTNLMKDLSGWNAATSFGTPDWAWNNADYHRSYWGKSYTYGIAGAALNGTNGVLNTTNGGWISLDQVVGTKIFNGTRVYCNENTNLIANLTDNGTATGNIVPNKTTSVLLRAVVCDQNGTPVQLVNYLGINFVKSNFIAKALEIANPSAYYTRAQESIEGELQFWPDGTPKYVYTGLSTDDVKVVGSDQGTGSVRLAAVEGTYYTLNGTEEKSWTAEDGTVYTWTEQKAVVASIGNINDKLATATNGTSNKAVAYTDGAMYYPIPVEHLHQPAASASEKVEGQFGVVRNHVYNITISKIKTLGEGVFVPKKVNPDDVIE